MAGRRRSNRAQAKHRGRCAPLPPRAQRVVGRGRGWGAFPLSARNRPPTPNPSPPCFAWGEGSTPLAWQHFSTYRRRVRSSAFQQESPVIVCRDLVANLPVPVQPGDIRHEHARLARDVCAVVPGVGLRIERRVGDLVDVIDPAVLGAFIGFDLLIFLSSRCRRQSAIQSTCCSIDAIMLDFTDGLPGPVIMNRLGNPPSSARDSCAGRAPISP